MRIALLTGGGDRPYVMGLTATLFARGIAIDIIGSDGLDSPEWYRTPGARFLNLRGDQTVDATLSSKVFRILAYYARLIRYAWGAPPKIFHILWNNKFEYFDRTLLMVFYRALGKRIVLTAHNVNKQKRDGTDSFLNRLTLKMQYALCDQIFVHTEKMKRELMADFAVPESVVTVIPFGINNAVPHTGLSSREARSCLGLSEDHRVILFFGRITGYKGVEFLVEAFKQLSGLSGNYRLIIAGRPDNDSKEYCAAILEQIKQEKLGHSILTKIEFVPDAETELYFKAADVLVLPYRDIYQSGVLFLSYSFGLPVVATDVGGLSEEIMLGKTGFLCRPEDSDDLANAILRYFESGLYKELDSLREEIKTYAHKRYSWEVVAERTECVYVRLAKS